MYLFFLFGHDIAVIGRFVGYCSAFGNEVVDKQRGAVKKRVSGGNKVGDNQFTSVSALFRNYARFRAVVGRH